MSSVFPTTSRMKESLDLHHEIEELRSKLIKCQNQSSQMEREFIEHQQSAENEISKLQDELAKFRDRYDRLYESHKKLQKLNHNLEDKLLTLVGQFNTSKAKLQTEVDNLTAQLRDAKIVICELEEECERYCNDCNIAVQLLQNDPSNFVGHRLTALPLDLQQRLKSQFTDEQLKQLEDVDTEPAPTLHRMIHVPMPTFPPTAMVYSVNRPIPVVESSAPKQEKNSTVPTNIIAKVLAQPKTKRKLRHVYICDKCGMDCMFQDESTQTTLVMCNSDEKSFHKQSSGQKFPQTAILIQPHVHTGRSRTNSTETQI